jgi:hypothetical protein
VAARGPQRSDGRDVNDVGVARIDHDVLDVFGVLEAHPLPGCPAIGRLVDAVAEADAALVVVLTGPEPDDVRVLRIDRDRAERVGALLVEDAGPGVAAVLGLPEVARGRRDVPHTGILRVDGDVGDPAGREARADTAEREGLHRVRGQAWIAVLRVQGRGGGHGAGREQNSAREVKAWHAITSPMRTESNVKTGIFPSPGHAAQMRAILCAALRLRSGSPRA